MLRKTKSRKLISLVLLLFLGRIWTDSIRSQEIEVPYTPATQIDVEVVPSVIFSEVNVKYIYEYKLISKQSSQQFVCIFDVEYDYSIENVIAPTGWTPGFYHDKNIIEWNSSDSQFFIYPGDFTEGFSFQSGGLPGIVTFYSRGFVELPPPVPMGEAPVEKLRPPSLEDSVNGKTIGPVPPPSESFEPISFIDHIITQKHAALDQGWIDNQGVANSLDQKLENAKNCIKRGKYKAAKTQINAFVNELEAQRGRHVNDSALFLLKPNAKYLIYKL